jgi:hypothetical protein
MNSDDKGAGAIPDAALSFEREKWSAECEFRRQDLKLRQEEQSRFEKELRCKIAETARSRWSNPLVIAIAGAALATAGNAVISWLNAKDQIGLSTLQANSTASLESTKAESDRILEVIKANDPDKAAANLQFLLQSGLIRNKDTKDYLEKFLATRVRGQGPALSSAQTSNVTPPPGATLINPDLGNGRQLAFNLSSLPGFAQALHYKLSGFYDIAGKTVRGMVTAGTLTFSNVSSSGPFNPTRLIRLSVQLCYMHPVVDVSGREPGTLGMQFSPRNPTSTNSIPLNIALQTNGATKILPPFQISFDLPDDFDVKRGAWLCGALYNDYWILSAL